MDIGKEIRIVKVVPEPFPLGKPEAAPAEPSPLPEKELVPA